MQELTVEQEALSWRAHERNVIHACETWVDAGSPAPMLPPEAAMPPQATRGTYTPGGQCELPSSTTCVTAPRV
jgi:hypothetical protein